ncbi:hypothetical protein [Pseudovibrio japonicus]|nr:hypothetical protein [Pseudovibrio japonicus]
MRIKGRLKYLYRASTSMTRPLIFCSTPAATLLLPNGF